MKTKRFLTSIVLILLSCEAFCQDFAPCQENGHKSKAARWRESHEQVFAVNFSIAGYPMSDKTISDYRDRKNSKSSPLSLTDMYKDYMGEIKTTGLIESEFNWNFSRWLNFSGYLGLCPVWSRTYNAMTDAKSANNFGMAIFIMPKIKVMYCNTRIVRVYSDFSIGLALYPGLISSEKSYSPFAAQLDFVGIELGGKWYGLAEIGLGTAFMGGKIGFGFKF